MTSAATGGRNHISNRVFSCKQCNAEEKRDRDWEEFLMAKYGHGAVFDARYRKIMEWVAAAGAVPLLPESILLVIEEQGRMVTAAYDEACKKVRNS